MRSLHHKTGIDKILAPNLMTRRGPLVVRCARYVERCCYLTRSQVPSSSALCYGPQVEKEERVWNLSLGVFRKNMHVKHKWNERSKEQVNEGERKRKH